MKNRILVLLMVLSLLLFSACSSDSNYAETMTQDAYAAPEMSEEDIAESGGGFATNSVAGTTEEFAEEVNNNDDRKIIYTSWMYLQAKEYEETANAVIAAVENAGGYVSSKYIRDEPYEDSVPYGTYECRIPQENYSQFINDVGSAGYVLSLEETSEDVTLEYVDIEARITSLRTQEASLLTMMEEATDVETLIVIQSNLMEVQYQIESYTSQMRTLENLVSYSTVTIDIEEVYEYTPPTPETFSSRIASAFSNSWEDFGYGAQDFTVALVYAIPSLLLLAVIALIIIVIIVKANKKAKIKAEEKAKLYRENMANMPNNMQMNNINAPMYNHMPVNNIQNSEINNTQANEDISKENETQEEK